MERATRQSGMVARRGMGLASSEVMVSLLLSEGAYEMFWWLEFRRVLLRSAAETVGAVGSTVTSAVVLLVLVSPSPSVVVAVTESVKLWSSAGVMVRDRKSVV